MENPWNIQSLYEFQYFNCPSCDFKNHSKQKLVNHAYKIHPESIEHLKNIKDISITGLVFPWQEQLSETEENACDKDLNDKNIITENIEITLDENNIKIEENINYISNIDSNKKEIATNHEDVREVQEKPSLSIIKAEENIIDQFDQESDKNVEDPLHIEKSNSNFVDNIQDNPIKNVEVVHKEVNMKQCYYCKESFSQDDDLIRHISSVHKVININDVENLNEIKNGQIHSNQAEKVEIVHELEDKSNMVRKISSVKNLKQSQSQIHTF